MKIQKRKKNLNHLVSTLEIIHLGNLINDL